MRLRFFRFLWCITGGVPYWRIPWYEVTTQATGVTRVVLAFPDGTKRTLCGDGIRRSAIVTAVDIEQWLKAWSLHP